LKKTISVLGVALFLVSITASAALNFQEEAPEKEFASVKEISPFFYCCIPHKGPYAEIQTIIDQLMEAIKEQKISPAGALIGIFYNSPGEAGPEDLKWEMGFPVSAKVEVKPPLEMKEWKFPLVVSAIHNGPYEETNKTLLRMFKWMQANKYAPVGPVLERYLTMLTADTKPEDLRTEIWIHSRKVEK
jgi:effector-binding domain-containing protein